MPRLPNKGVGVCLWNCASERNRFAFCIRGATRCRVVIVVAVARCLGSTKNPQRRDDDLSHCLRRALPILELPRLQAPFDKDYGPFRHKLFGNLRQLIPGDAANPFHVLVSVLLAAEWLIDSEREIRDRFAARRGLHLCILPGISEQNDFVRSDIRHDVFASVFKEISKGSHETRDRRKRVPLEKETPQCRSSNSKVMQSVIAPTSCKPPRRRDPYDTPRCEPDALVHAV